MAQKKELWYQCEDCDFETTVKEDADKHECYGGKYNPNEADIIAMAKDSGYKGTPEELFEVIDKGGRACNDEVYVYLNLYTNRHVSGAGDGLAGMGALLSRVKLIK